MKRKRSYLSIIVVLIMCMQIGFINVSAAESPVKSGPQNYDGKELNILSIKWDFMDTMLGKYAQEIADQMGIKLNISFYTYDESRQKVVADTIANVSTWDIIYIDTKQMPEYATVGALEPMEGLFEKYGRDSFDLDDFTTNPMQEATYQGIQYGIPIMSDTNGLVYRTDLFENEEEKAAFYDKYGYELKVPETYSEFSDIAEFFTRKKGEKLCGEVLKEDFYGTCHSDKVADFLWHDYLSYMYAFGADVYDEETMMPLWDSEENLAAGKYYVEKLGPTMPEGHINMTSGESMAQFDAGNLAMIIEFYSRTLYLGGEDSSIQGKFDFALLPTQDEERPHATILSTNFMGIYSKSEKKEMAMDFLQELTNKETAKKMAFHEPDGMYNVGNPLFPRESVLQDPALLKKFPALSLVLQTLNQDGVYAFNHIQIPEYPQIIEIGGTALAYAFNGANIQECFKNAQQEMEKVFRDAGYIE